MVDASGLVLLAHVHAANLRDRVGAAQAAIEAFPADLPYELEEEREDGKRTAVLRRRAEIWAKLGQRENHAVFSMDDGSGSYVQLVNPRSADPDLVAISERHATMVEHLMLLNWARDCFDQRSLSEKLPLPAALERARRLDDQRLFAEPHGLVDPDDQRRAAVAGTAAVTLCFAEELDEGAFDWAGGAILRAAATPEQREGIWFPGSILPYHPCLFAAEGLAALVRKEVAAIEAKRALVRLAGHPHEQISQATLGAALGLWDRDGPAILCRTSPSRPHRAVGVVGPGSRDRNPLLWAC